jgi:hypothetical protein
MWKKQSTMKKLLTVLFLSVASSWPLVAGAQNAPPP